MATRHKFAVRKSLRRRPKKSKLPATSRARVKKTKKPHYVYYFGDGHADGSGGMKPLLGGKGANLHEMTRIGLPVPPGFTITTEVCTHFLLIIGLTLESWRRNLRPRWQKSKIPLEKNLVTTSDLCSCPCDRARGIPCPE